jgi:hypothetical protein
MKLRSLSCLFLTKGRARDRNYLAVQGRAVSKGLAARWSFQCFCFESVRSPHELREKLESKIDSPPSTMRGVGKQKNFFVLERFRNIFIYRLLRIVTLLLYCIKNKNSWNTYNQAIKGAVQGDGSGRKWSHSKDLN